MDIHGAHPERLSWRTRLEAGLALVPAFAAATWLVIDAPGLRGLYVTFALLFVIPQLAVTTRGFIITSLVIAGLPVLATVSVVGIFLGLVLFLPASAATLAAAGLAARNAPGRVMARACLWLVTAGAAAGFGSATYHYFNPPSNTVIVQLATPDRSGAEPWRLLDALTQAGFTSVSIGEQGGCYGQVDVEIAAAMPERRRLRLLQLVRAQPEVAAAYWCQGTQCYETQCNDTQRNA
jgi:hypothetical protein